MGLIEMSLALLQIRLVMEELLGLMKICFLPISMVFRQERTPPCKTRMVNRLRRSFFSENCVFSTMSAPFFQEV